MPFTRPAFIPLLLATAAVAPLSAQGYPPSERGSVSQSVALTDITVAYGRPIAHGRKLFGDSGVVAWGRIWCPGADTATRITFSHDVELEGHPVQAGEYSAWLIPHPDAPWTLILSRAVHVMHTPYPGEANDALRVDLAPQHGDYLETLTWYFPTVIRDTAVMRVQWGDTYIAVRLRAPWRQR